MKKKWLRSLLIAGVSLLPMTCFADNGLSRTVKIGNNAFFFKSSDSYVQGEGYDHYRETYDANDQAYFGMTPGTTGPKIYVKDFYGGMFPIYMPYQGGDADVAGAMKAYINENTQTDLGWGGAHLVPGELNVKKGGSDPFVFGIESYYGDGVANIWADEYGQNVEYRYQGYLLDATVVNNPFFPSDFYGSTPPEDKKWLTFDTVKTSPYISFSPSFYNNEINTIPGGSTTFAQATFEKWFNSTEIGAKFKAKANSKGIAEGKEWEYWNEYFQIQGDITEGSVSITAWHNVNGHWYYQSFPIPSRPQNNLTVLKLEIQDKETGEILESYYRDIDFNDPTNQTKMSTTSTDGTAVLKRNTEYRVVGEVYYTGLKSPMDSPSLMSTRALATIPAFMDFTHSHNEGYAFTRDGVDEVIAEDDKGVELRSVLPGETMTFVIEDYMVPEVVTEKGRIEFSVPADYLHNNDNAMRSDDYSAVFYQIEGVDMSMNQQVELIKDGGSVNYVTPNESHELIFRVDHEEGQTPVGLDDLLNPKTTIDVTVKDLGDNTIINQTFKATDVLEPDGSVAIKIPNVQVGTTGLEACAVINSVHKEKGFNDDSSNDSVCETFVSVKNYAIKELKITPHLVQFDRGSSGSSENLTFTYDLANEGMGGTDTPLVVVKSNGSVIASYRPHIPSDAVVEQSITVPNVYIGNGENTFSIEVNPSPREVTETRTDGLSPYADNIGSDTVVGKQYAECVDCSNQRTYNTWSEEFSWVEKDGNWERYKSCSGSGENRTCSWYTYCDIDYDRWEEVKSYYESYEMVNVFYRSKWTKDTQGGDGWVDLLDGDEAKIKAGYGFELKVLVKYDTNRNNLPSPDPVSWSECSYGLSRSPGAPSVEAPNVLYLEMPFKSNGSDVCYMMSYMGYTGSWSNRTQIFELPMRNSFDIADERKIYTNEDARPGVYTMKLRTPVWGAYEPITPVDTSNKKVLQDCYDIEMEILPQDDLKSHIIQ